MRERQARVMPSSHVPSPHAHRVAALTVERMVERVVGGAVASRETVSKNARVRKRTVSDTSCLARATVLYASLARFVRYLGMIGWLLTLFLLAAKMRCINSVCRLTFELSLGPG